MPGPRGVGAWRASWRTAAMRSGWIYSHEDSAGAQPVVLTAAYAEASAASGHALVVGRMVRHARRPDALPHLAFGPAVIGSQVSTVRRPLLAASSRLRRACWRRAQDSSTRRPMQFSTRAGRPRSSSQPSASSRHGRSCHCTWACGGVPDKRAEIGHQPRPEGRYRAARRCVGSAAALHHTAPRSNQYDPHTPAQPGPHDDTKATSPTTPSPPPIDDTDSGMSGTARGRCHGRSRFPWSVRTLLAPVAAQRVHRVGDGSPAAHRRRRTARG